MKKCIALLFLLVLLAGCAAGGRRVVRGEGPRVPFTLAVADFTGLSVSGGFDLTFRQGPFSVELEIQENLYELMEATVVNGVLELGFSRTISTTASNTPRLTIYAPDLQELRVSGAVSGNMQLAVDALYINIAGAANLTLGGSATQLEIHSAGAANVNAFNLRTVDAVISVAGAGSVDVYASGTLDVSIAGVGHVRYDGDAVLTRSVAGLGSIRQR